MAEFIPSETPMTAVHGGTDTPAPGSAGRFAFDEETATLGASGPISQTSKQWGEFQLLQRLGQGGFGEVYRAWDPVLEREVALKLLLPRGLDAEQEYLSIVAEARAIARVRHPNIVSVYGVDRRDQRVGFWSDYVRGRTLSQIVETQGPLSAEETARIGATLAQAVAAVHAAGLLHRDIKASNAMRDENGHILLMDFGLSQNLQHKAPSAGTPRYMAPELLAGSAATVQSDLYALGILLYFLHTGAYPASPGQPALTALDAVIARVTARDPDDRYRSAAKLAEALNATLQNAIPEARVAEPVQEDKRRKRVVQRYVWLLIPLYFLVGKPIQRFFHPGAPDAPAETTPASYQDYLAADAALQRFDKPGNTALALKLFQKTLDLSPDFALAEAGLARASWRMYQDTEDKQWADKANKEAAKALEMNAELAAVQMTAGSLHADQGNFDLGLQELQKAKDLDPQSADVHAALGEAYRQQGRLPQAKTELESAKDLAPDNWRWPYLLGALDYDSGDFPAAEQEFTTSLEKAPDNADVLYNIGVLYWHQKRLPEARSMLEKAIAYAPSIEPVMALGSVLLQQGEYTEAASTYQRAVQLNPASWRAWGNLASAYEWSGGDPLKIADGYRKAIELAANSLKTTPGDAELVSQVASYHASLHQEKDALPLIRRSLLLGPNNPDIIARAGESYDALGNRQEALKLIAQALQLGLSVDYARKTPALKSLRKDPDAPQQIRE